MKYILSILVFLLATVGQAQKAAKSGKEIQRLQKAADSFFHAFNNLEWETFRNSFTADATVFGNNPPHRVNGKDSVEAHFKLVFDEIRKDC